MDAAGEEEAADEPDELDGVEAADEDEEEEEVGVAVAEAMVAGVDVADVGSMRR